MGKSVAVHFSSLQRGICALGKAHIRFTPPLRGFPSVAFETVPMFVWLTMVLSHPFKEDRRVLLLSTHLSSRPFDGVSVLGSVPAGSVSSSPTPEIFREAISHL